MPKFSERSMFDPLTFKRLFQVHCVQGSDEEVFRPNQGISEKSQQENAQARAGIFHKVFAFPTAYDVWLAHRPRLGL